mgnify:CR=1 FL=1
MKSSEESKEGEKLRELTRIAEETHRFGSIERHLTAEGLKKLVRQKVSKVNFKRPKRETNMTTDAEERRREIIQEILGWG